MKSFYLPAAVIAALCLAYLATGEDRFVLFLVVMGFFYLLAIIAAFSPTVRKLYMPIGPRTDVRYMTRLELLRSSVTFAGLGLGSMVVMILAASILPKLGDKVAGSPVTLGIFFVAFVLTAIWFVGGVYLLIRGLLRRRDYDPRAVYERDQAMLAQRNKEDNPDE